MGFEGKVGDKTFESKDYTSTDVKPDNVLVDKNGKVHLIDTQFEAKETVENSTYYPLSRPLFIYVSEASAKKPEVKGGWAQFEAFLNE